MGVRMFKPKTLAEVYCLTNLQEASLNAIKRKNRLLYSGGASTSMFIPQPDVNQNTKPLLALPQNKPTPAYKLNNRKQLTQKEYEDKRAKNLFFYYDQKYAPGHKCHGQLRTKGGNHLESRNSLNALNGVSSYKTLRIRGCSIKSTCPLAVAVGDGFNTLSNSKCKKFKWQVQGVEFCLDVMFLKLGGYEMVFGIQWLSTLGDIKFNFKDLSKVVRQGNKAELSSMQLCVYPEPTIQLWSMEGVNQDMPPELFKVETPLKRH
ncbi:hypothetical protein Tco_0715054 [Tanacetum coccineum]